MGNGVFVWIEQFEGQLASASWEAMGVARRLADERGGLFGGDGLAGAGWQTGT